MNIKKIVMIASLCIGLQETKSLDVTGLIAVWVGCSYFYRIANHWIDAQQAANNQLTAEDIQKMLIVLQSNQRQFEDCKKNEEEILKRLDQLVQEIYSHRFATQSRGVCEFL